jgi:hypothetical protein
MSQGRLSAVVGLTAVAVAAALVLPGCGGDEDSTPTVTGAALHQLKAAARSQRTTTTTDTEVRVPEVAGEPVVRARHELAHLGLRFSGRFPGTAGNPDLPTDCLTVTAQGTAPGTRVPEGSEVVGTIGVCHNRIPRISRRSSWPPWD